MAGCGDSERGKGDARDVGFGRADKQIILAPVSKPASALKHPARMSRDLQGTSCSFMSSSCTSGAVQLYGF